MHSRTSLAACLASAAALIGPAVVPTSAHADVGECAPITIGGQVAGCVSVSATPSQQPNGDPQLDITATLQVFGLEPVTRTVTGTVPVAEVESDAPTACDASGQRVTREGEWGEIRT
ncbi:MAG: hypothetical protein QOD07_1346 [Frankiaceae bacterium]|nr:hypothetical protein [Frankiaceae bacterium]